MNVFALLLHRNTHVPNIKPSTETLNATETMRTRKETTDWYDVFKAPGNYSQFFFPIRHFSTTTSNFLLLCQTVGWFSRAVVVTGRHFSSTWEADIQSAFKMRIKTSLLYKVGLDFPELLVDFRPITSHLVFPHFTIFSYYSPLMHSINFLLSVLYFSSSWKTCLAQYFCI